MTNSELTFTFQPDTETKLIKEFCDFFSEFIT